MVGVAAHISAASPGGARYNPLLTADQRRHADNGIWLCQICAKLVDDDEVTYPEALLREWKRSAEASALTKLGKTAAFGLIEPRDLIATLATYVSDNDVHLVLAEGMKRLTALHGEHLTVRTDGEGLILEIGQDGASSPLIVFFTPAFPDTAEGKDRAAAWDEFVRIGTPVELLSSDIPRDQLPFEIRDLVDRQGEFTLRIGTSRRSRPMPMSLEVQNETGESYMFPYLEFRVVASGTERATLSNAGQPIPFQIEIDLASAGGVGIRWSFDLDDAYIYWFLEFLRFKRVLKTPVRSILTLLDTGMQSASAIPSGEDSDVIHERVIPVLERVLKIQRRTGTPIRIPPRTFLDELDEGAIQWFEAVLQTGRQPEPPIDFRITVTEPDGKQTLQKANGAPFSVRIPHHIEQLLDNDVDLGPVWVKCQEVQVELLQENATNDSYVAEFRLSPAKGHVLDVIYERFAPEALRSELARARAAPAST